MTDPRVKYPRTPHLPWSQGASRDDLVLDGAGHFEAVQEVVVTEKLDWENTTLYTDRLHARSLDSKSHPSRNWLKAFHASISYKIPADTRICGENVFTRHSIGYDRLTTYFYVFSIFRKELCLGWQETGDICRELGLALVPVLYAGPWVEARIRSCWKGGSAFGPDQEGYVVRNAGAFLYSEFKDNVAKYVRPGHVNTDAHWTSAPVVPNRLAPASVG